MLVIYDNVVPIVLEYVQHRSNTKFSDQPKLELDFRVRDEFGFEFKLGSLKSNQTKSC